MGQPAFIVDDPFVADRLNLPLPRVDRDKCIVYGVRLAGPKSRNGYVFPEAVQRAAVPMFAGVSVLIGHHLDPHTMRPLPPPPEKKFGRVLDPRFEHGGVHGDLKYHPKKPFAEDFLWAVENDPGFYALSQHAAMKWADKPDADGNRVAEAYRVVSSVDIVHEGGCTSTIFDSYTPEANMATPPDPKAIASSLDTAGAWMAFLTDLFGELKGAGLDQTAKDAILGLVTSALSATAEPPADAAASPDQAAAAMQCLMRFGKVGRWAAEHLDRFFAADRKGRREKWAADIIRAEQLPEPLATPVFVSLVADHFGNDARAKELIADRKQLTAGGSGGKGTKTSEPGGAKSLKDIVDSFVIG